MNQQSLALRVRLLPAALLLAALAVQAVPARAAMTAHLYLRANGEDIAGDGTVPGRPDAIECLSIVEAGPTTDDKASGKATGRRTYEPIVIRKRIDKSTPLIARALVGEAVIDGRLELRRGHPATGEIEHFFTIEFRGGRIASQEKTLPDVLDPDTATLPPLEEVGISFTTIRWTYEDGGISAEDSWRP